MDTLANSLKRIWSAKNRVPHLTGWGTSGFIRPALRVITPWAHRRMLDFAAIARRTAPTILLIAYNIFR
jgi:hypothetical protein